MLYSMVSSTKKMASRIRERQSVFRKRCLVVQKKLTPLRKPRKSGGSPKGVREPPMLATRKMKNTTECTRYLRWALARSRGRISSMAAPVVPIQLARAVPTASSAVFTAGVPTREPLRRTPPATVNSAKSRTIKGM